MSTASMYGTDTITGRVIAATVVGMVLPTIAVLGRVTARYIKGIRLYLDDYMIILALLFKFGIDIAGCILIENGLGRHIGTVTAAQMLVFLKVQYTGVILYPFCVAFTKLSILLQYKRLFASRFFRYAVDVLIIITILWCISVCFTGVFLCTPIKKSWLPETPGNCINLISFYYGLQVPNVVTDAAILLLPLKEVADLQLPAKQKVGVALTCALWMLCLVCGIVRLVVMVDLSSGSDVTYILTNAAVWTTVEPTVGIVTACLPSVRILYRSLARACGHHRVESQRLTSLSEGSAMRTGQTLVEQPRSSRPVSYGDCMGEKRSSVDMSGEELEKYPSSGDSPTSPSSSTKKDFHTIHEDDV